MTVAEATELTGLARERLALLVLQGRLAIAESVKRTPDERPPRLLLLSELAALKLRMQQEPLPF